jgi:Zinc knuckle
MVMKTESRTAVTFVTSTQNPTSRMAKGKKGNNKLEEKKPKDKEEKDLSHITCFICGKQGHYATKCPKKAKPEKNDDAAEVGVNATWEVEQEANMFLTLEENVVNTAGTQNQINLTEALLDNQADISILHPSLLSDVRDSETKIRVKGIEGFQMVVKDKGMLKIF